LPQRQPPVLLQLFAVTPQSMQAEPLAPHWMAVVKPTHWPPVEQQPASQPVQEIEVPPPRRRCSAVRARGAAAICACGAAAVGACGAAAARAAVPPPLAPAVPPPVEEMPPPVPLPPPRWRWCLAASASGAAVRPGLGTMLPQLQRVRATQQRAP